MEFSGRYHVCAYGRRRGLVADQPGEAMTEIHFSANRGVYKSTLLLCLIATAVAAFFLVVEIIALTSEPNTQVQVGLRHYRVGIFNQLWVAIIGCGSGLIALGTLTIVALDTRRNWHYWHQLRKPNVTVNTDGVRFEARRHALNVPWSDVERLVLRRFIYTSRSSSILRLQVSADSALIQTENNPFSSHRWLLIGEIEGQVDVPCGDAIDILQRIAGPRLEISEDIYQDQNR